MPSVEILPPVGHRLIHYLFELVRISSMCVTDLLCHMPAPVFLCLIALFRRVLLKPFFYRLSSIVPWQIDWLD